MSWQSYVDDHMVKTGHVSRGAIIGLDGNTWATSAGFTVAPAEGQKLVAGFNDPAGLMAAGIHVAGTKYMTIRADDRSIYGKKGAGGVTMVKTKQAVLIGVYDEGIQPGNCNLVVEKLADYLIEVGY